MLKFYTSLVFVILTAHALLWSQNTTLTSDTPFKQYEEISKLMASISPEEDIKTFRRASFSDVQMQRYLSLHFKRLDLLDDIQGHTAFVLDSYLHSGNWFRAVGFPKESIKSYLDFFQYYETHEDALTAVQREGYRNMRSYARSILAENYAKLGLLDNAALQYKKNIAFTKNLNYIYHPSSLNNYGLFFYWYKKDLDSAMYFFDRAYKLTQSKFPNHTLNGSIRDNIADIYIKQQSYDKALPLYEQNFDFFQSAINEETLTKDIPRLISAGSQLVTTLTHLNQLEAAQHHFKTLDSITASEEANVNSTISSKLEFLNAKEILLRAQHNIPEAYNTVKEIAHVSDSLQALSNHADKKWQEELNDITIDRIELNFKIDRIQKENMIKSQSAKLWFIGLLSSIFIILLVAIIISRRQHLINAKNKQLLAEQKFENTALKVKQLNSEIKSKERDLSDFAIKLTHDQDWAKSLAEQLKVIKQAHSEERPKLINALDVEISNKISVDSDTQEFFERLDKLSDAFYSKLIEQYPNLSKNEIRLCSLIRLKIESRSIATLQNITLASLNTSRYRLRKKLNLSEDTDLDSFIQNI
ncbi:tetratricopeptide repeat protein [Winogradskyella psychrotolerans]|uniref:tetratricopeptide repeat protein n=1 Tax=Winogradskyella psychrotolerans TaxID=1344585 RepID=UPI001C072D17|nr:tetratricopeptide repeat protein [Winogradskyella psychrotolerans]MBU2929333.1 tetratricopeptide repeat protein [Winogradskyella psychrotolerans]